MPSNFVGFTTQDMSGHGKTHKVSHLPELRNVIWEKHGQTPCQINISTSSSSSVKVQRKGRA